MTVGGALIGGGAFRTSRDLSGATTIVITIEPTGNNDTAPAQTKVLAGAVSGRTASLTISAPQALGNSFAGAAGKYILATPTDGMNNNELSGIWFLDPSGGAQRLGSRCPNRRPDGSTRVGSH